MSAFTFTGEFAGYIRLANGKKRLVLRTLSQEMILKVPREMREELEGMLLRGGTITVHGVEEHEDEHHQFLVTALDLGPGNRPEACTIRVCSKKNCWKQGGREVAHALEQELETEGLSRMVRVKLSGCLDCCKRAPTMACNEHYMTECTPETARDLASRLANRLRGE